MRLQGRILTSTFLALLCVVLSVHALEIRGSIADLSMSEVVWDSQNFAGFYYDIDKNIGSERIIFRLSSEAPYAARLDDYLDADGMRGIVYMANKQHVKALNNAKEDMAFGKLSVASINETTGDVLLDNKDNAITISKNKRIELIPGLGIKTADQDGIDYANPLRYYIYREITEPGTYELRGAVADLRFNEFTWSPRNFAGFYYDIDRNIGNENLTLRPIMNDGINATLSDGIDSNGMRGVVYTTSAQPKNFKFRPWGQYSVIGFLGEGYFAAYNNEVTQGMPNAGESVAFLFDRSRNRNLMTCEQLSKILIDDASVKLVKKGESIKLKEGYELFLKGVNSEGKVYLQLIKNGQVIDEELIAPSIPNAMMFDKTYYYINDIGITEDIVQIAVHFRTTYKDEEQAFAAVDGIWQISEAPTRLNLDLQYGKMSIRSIDATSMMITMDNKDNQINLSRKINVELMPSLHLRTADNETLRYYIYKTETIA